MAKGILTVSDDGNGLHVEIDFEPAVENGEKGSVAQWYAVKALELLTEFIREQENESEADHE